MRFNWYRIIGGAVMCLNAIGQTKAKIDKVDPVVGLVTGASLYTIHPYAPVAFKAADYAEPAAMVITNFTNEYWQSGLREEKIKAFDKQINHQLYDKDVYDDEALADKEAVLITDETTEWELVN